MRAPTWVASFDEAAKCGTCHGIPPQNFAHAFRPTLRQCVFCHSRTVDGSGNIIITNGTSRHMNGVVDASGGG